VLCKLSTGHQIHANPPQVAQNENQLVEYKGTIQAISPYFVQLQSTSVRLATEEVGTFSKPKGIGITASKSGGTVSYRIAETKPFTAEPLYVHFKSNKPFLSILDLQREITVFTFSFLVTLVDMLVDLVSI
jgi:hypothetical protein